MRGHRALAVTALLVPVITGACASGRRSEPNPLLASVAEALVRVPRSVATFDMEFMGGLIDGSMQSVYRSRGDSTVKADVVIRQLVTPEADDSAYVRRQANAALAASRGTLTDSLTSPPQRATLTYQTPAGAVAAYRVRTSRVLNGARQGLHVYTMVVGQRLIAIRASHPQPLDAAGEIDQFAEALAVQMSEWAPAAAAPAPTMIPAKRIDGFDLVDTRRYPTPDAGIQYRYQDSTGREADVYIYRGDAPRFGTNTMAALRDEVGNFREALPLGQARGYYNAYSVESDTLLTVRVRERDVALHRIRMAMTRDGQAQDSYFYLAVVRGEFVKIRITQPPGKFPVARADAFVQAVLENVSLGGT